VRYRPILFVRNMLSILIHFGTGNTNGESRTSSKVAASAGGASRVTPDDPYHLSCLSSALRIPPILLDVTSNSNSNSCVRYPVYK